jgi:TRAP-type C4-dicarboxylate transport system permease small subunit
MARFFSAVLTVGNGMHFIACSSLVFLMLLTLTDVLLRQWGTPILGAYEIVGYLGGMAIGLAMPVTSWQRGHVYVDTFLTWLPRIARAAVNICTRAVCAGLFVVLAWNLVRLGLDLRGSGEVSPTLELKYYPVAFGLAAASVVQTIVLLCQIVMACRGEYE